MRPRRVSEFPLRLQSSACRYVLRSRGRRYGLCLRRRRRLRDLPERGEHRRFRTAPGEGLPYASRSPCGRVPLRGAGHAEGGGGDAAGARGEVPDCRTRRREDGGAERHARPCSRRPRGTRRAAARYALARHESAQRRDVRSVRRQRNAVARARHEAYRRRTAGDRRPGGRGRGGLRLPHHGPQPASALRQQRGRERAGSLYALRRVVPGAKLRRASDAWRMSVS